MALFVTDQYGAATNAYLEDVTGQMQTAVAAPQNEAGAAPQKGAGAPLESSEQASSPGMFVPGFADFMLTLLVSAICAIAINVV